MEDVDEAAKEASEPFVLLQSPDATNMVSAQEGEEEPDKEADEEFSEDHWESQNNEEEESEKRMINLQRHLKTLVTDIQTAADAKESMRRTELEEARRIRFERLEDDIKSSQELLEENARGWSIAKEKVIPQDLQEVLNNQQQLCATIIEDKKKLINDLQQELKVGDDRYVKDLRKHAEELDLMMERMEEQIKTLAKAYREELAQIARVYQQENEVLLTGDKTEWERRMKELWDEELRRLTQRKKKVEEYEEIIHNLILETTVSQAQAEHKPGFQVLEIEQQRKKATTMVTKLNQITQRGEIAASKFSLSRVKSRNASLQTEINKIQDKTSSHDKQFKKKEQYLSKDHKRNQQQFEHMQKKIKHFAVADARQFEEMWLMIDEEVKQLVERVLLIDWLICKRHLGLPWEQPPMEFMELSGPVQPQKQTWKPPCEAVCQLFHTRQASQSGQKVMDLSGVPRLETGTESMDMEWYKEGTAVQSDSGAEMEEGKLSSETLKKLMELLSDEVDFLMEDKLLNLLAPLEKEEQTVVKLGSLFSSFGFEEEDVPKLADFLLKYKHEQKEQTEDACVESGESSDKVEEVETKSTTSELINPNSVLPALKSFLEQHRRSRERSARQHHSLGVEKRDTSEDKAYWENIGNIISEDKVKVWDAAENTLNEHLAVLTEISELIPETESLKQQNAELRMLLQTSLNSGVTT